MDQDKVQEERAQLQVELAEWRSLVKSPGWARLLKLFGEDGEQYRTRSRELILKPPVGMDSVLSDCFARGECNGYLTVLLYPEQAAKSLETTLTKDKYQETKDATGTEPSDSTDALGDWVSGLARPDFRNAP